MKRPSATPASRINSHIGIPFLSDFTRIVRRLTHYLQSALCAVLLIVQAACGGPEALRSTLVPQATGPFAPAAILATPSRTFVTKPDETLKVDGPHYERVAFDALPGWRDDQLFAAWPAFLQSCHALHADPHWHDICMAAPTTPLDAESRRDFFEARFVPYRLLSAGGHDTGLVTGYYEPLLRGSRTRTSRFTTPIYGVPDDLITVDLGDLYPELKGMHLRGRLLDHRIVPYPSRAELANWNALHGHELVWVDDPLEAFFLQVQGSGRIQLYRHGQPGEVIRLTFADQNGRPYRSVGRWLVDHGEMPLESASKAGIETWVRKHPARLDELLDADPNYVFFKEVPISDPAAGPNGSLGVPLTAGRSIAVDPRVVPLGTPVYLALTAPDGSGRLPNRLTFAQDTGSAIKAVPDSAVRADLFFGFGAPAGVKAGELRQEGRMWILLPRGVAPPL